MFTEILATIGKFILKPFPPVTTEEKDTITYWRDTIYYYTIVLYTYVGLIVLLISVYASIRYNLFTLAGCDILLYCSSLLFILSKNFSIDLKCKILAIIIYIVGITALLFTGPFGAGLLWLFTFPLFVGILLGIKKAYIALTINFISLVVLGVGLHYRYIDKLVFATYNSASWTVTSINFILLNVATTISLTIIIDGIKKSLQNQSLIQKQLIVEKESLEKARLQAEENNREKSNFLANLSHEFRTPMNAILGFSSLLRSKSYPPEKQDLFQNIIEEKGQYLLQLVNDLVDYAKIEANQVHLFVEPCNLCTLFEELEAFFAEEAIRVRKTELTIKFNKTEENKSMVIDADITRLKQIMINFLSNALKFTNQGSIEFGFNLSNKKTIRFYVKDTGVGIDASDQSKIFYRFEQALKNPQTSTDGYGLGLHITKNLVNLMVGKIWVESELNKGSCFYVELPYHPSIQMN